MTLRYRWHRTLAHLWWNAEPIVKAPLYWPTRTNRGERLYTALWPVFGRASTWCVQQARMHWHLADDGTRTSWRQTVREENPPHP